MSQIEWDRFGCRLWNTLTYPGTDGAEFIPTDGRVAYGHLRAFIKRLRREWAPDLIIWKREFQPRVNSTTGPAIHYHLAVLWQETPEGFHGSLGDFREWQSRSWYEVVGSGAATHLRAGTSCEVMMGDPSGYLACYFKGGNNKADQHKLPEGFVHPGRWWGIFASDRAYRPQTRFSVKLSASEFHRTRRVLSGLRRSRSKSRRRIKRGGPVRSMWARGGQCTAHLTTMAGRYLSALRGKPVDVGDCPGLTVVDLELPWARAFFPADVAAKMWSCTPADITRRPSVSESVWRAPPGVREHQPPSRAQRA
jgi:hypothetical protein